MEIQSLRTQINDIDERLEEYLMQRFGILKDVAEVKKRKNLPVEDIQREKKILQHMKQRMPKEFSEYIEEIFNAIFSVSKKYQKQLIGE